MIAAANPVLHRSAATPQQGWRRTVKILLDRVAAAVLLVLLSPVLIGVAAAVAIFLGRPVLFRQVRPGHKGRPFTLLKFRTMTEARDPQGRLLPDAERLPRFGRFLRATSLDELPELWNVLRGDMSLVGPRPLLMQYLGRYTPEQARRHDVLPGLTGWCQVNGRNDLEWERKFALDLWYVENWSLMLDLHILAMTAAQLVRPRGIHRAGHATTAEFMGSTGAESR